MLTVGYPVSLLSSSSFNHSSFLISLSSSNCNFQLPKKPNSAFMPSFPSSKSFIHSQNYSIWRATQLGFCFQNGVSQDFTDTQFDKSPQSGRIHDTEELELLDKPSPKPTNIESASEVEHVTSKPDKDEALAPFLRFFNSRDAEDEQTKGDEKGFKRVVVEYYEPEPGDFVVGVVVSGNENKLDVNIGADLLGTMLTKEVLPLYDKEMDFLLCDVDKNAEEFLGNGKLGIIQNEDALSGQLVPGRPVVDVGTVLFAEVLGRTLSGRPLLSTRRFFKRIAWHRVRQIKQLDEPIEVRITEWNTGGLLTRIEGLRAFLPKAELMNRVNNFADLKENVGRHIYVQIIRLNEADNDLILSEREAWEKRYLQEGTLLEGTVRKIFLFGAQVRLGQTNRSGLLHISNISRGKVTSVSDLLTVGEKVKVLVITSLFPDKISLSTADLESEPGLLISNKEKVFEEAEVMAKKYRQKLPAISAPRKSEPPLSKPLQFDDETSLYANWKWFKFQREDGSEGQ